MPLSSARVALLCLLVIAVAPPAAGQDRAPGFAREGVYVGIAPQVDATLDGVSFDGLTLYERIGGTEVAILPKLDEQTTMRALVGFRSRPLALEFSVERARHGGTFDDVPVTSVLTAFNVDGRFFFRTTQRVQPHLVLGISIPLLRVEDGSFDDPLLGDARWRGTGLNTEVGVTVFATPRLGLSVGYVYRPIWFTTVRGVHDEPLELLPKFRESSAHPSVMAFWAF
jgi:hypothetical protein